MTNKLVCNGVRELPSAQPEKHTEERTETHACDLIDRQAAIDAFKPYADYESNRTNADWVRRIELVLHDLPSAQPDLDEVYAHAETEAEARYHAEIVRCKDCKQFRRWIDTDICFCDITEAEMSDNDFCSKAERITDDR